MTRTRNDADEPHAPEALASLRARAERTLREAPDLASAALPLLHRLVRLAPPGADATSPRATSPSPRRSQPVASRRPGAPPDRPEP